MSEELVCHFGKHKGTPLSDIPTGYLRWCIENIDPVPMPKYRFKEDGSPMSVEEVKAVEADNRTFLQAAELLIAEREDNGEEK